MTRRDFVMIAATLAGSRPDSPHEPGAMGERASAAYVQWTTDRDAFADALAGTNPLFDRARFIAAANAGAGR